MHSGELALIRTGPDAPTAQRLLCRTSPAPLPHHFGTRLIVAMIARPLRTGSDTHTAQRLIPRATFADRSGTVLAHNFNISSPAPLSLIALAPPILPDPQLPQPHDPLRSRHSPSISSALPDVPLSFTATLHRSATISPLHSLVMAFHRLVADLHLHSRFSMATSPQLNIESLAATAAEKGIGLLAAPDFTHPAWREEMRSALEPSGEGVYRLRNLHNGHAAARSPDRQISSLSRRSPASGDSLTAPAASMSCSWRRLSKSQTASAKHLPTTSGLSLTAAQ